MQDGNNNNEMYEPLVGDHANSDQDIDEQS